MLLTPGKRREEEREEERGEKKSDSLDKYLAFKLTFSLESDASAKLLGLCREAGTDRN